jgi:ATP-dependent DNA ligase
MENEKKPKEHVLFTLLMSIAEYCEKETKILDGEAIILKAHEAQMETDPITFAEVLDSLEARSNIVKMRATLTAKTDLLDGLFNHIKTKQIELGIYK